jgi:DNA-binding SARP family transcriptional activator/tetratricopeptide (TPR) repeat protein
MIILRTLGTASIEIEGPTIITPSSPRRFALLLYLAAEHGRDVTREQLANLVFADQSPAKGSHSVREALYQLRRLGLSIPATPTGFAIPSEMVRADYELAARDAAVDDEMLRAMAGGFLPAFSPPKSESYVEWLDGLRATHGVAITRRLLPDLDLAMRGAQWEVAERIARASLGIDPCNERATFALAEILSTGGSKAGAMQLIERYAQEIGPRAPDLLRRAANFQRRISSGKSSASGGADNDIVTGHSSPRLVGRTADFAAMLDAFYLAQSGEPQCVVVAGEPGIGKTRLVGDFSDTVMMRGARVERVTSQPHDGARPMGAFVDLVPTLIEAGGALGCSPPALAALRNLIGQRPTEESNPPTAAAEEHEQRWTSVSRAVVDLCEAIADERTVVLVIEDAHWLDALSANTIGRIVGTRRNARIMVIATTRDPRPLLREIRLTERCRTLSLAPLDPAASDELLDLVLLPNTGACETPAESVSSIKARIAASSAGNPLFLITLAGHSRTHGGAFEVPGTVVEMFAQRIDHLSRRATTVLATCAELGKHSTLERLTRALEIRRHDLAEALMELWDSGLVLHHEEDALPTHPMVSEALRSRLPQPVRRALARSTAATLEADAKAYESPALWWDAAESWQVAGDHRKAISALRQCANHALRIGRPGEAARILEHAALLPQSPEELRGLSTEFIQAASSAGEFPLVLRGAELLRSATREQGHDHIEMAELSALFATRHPDESLTKRLSMCVAAAEAEPNHRVAAAILLLKCADMTGRCDLSGAAINAVSKSDLGVVEVYMKLEFEILAASTQGDRKKAASIGRKLIARFGRDPDHLSIPLSYYQTGVMAVHLGGYEHEAVTRYKRMFDYAERRASYRGRQFAAVRLASLLMDRGAEGEAVAWLNKAIAIAAERVELADETDLATLRLEVALFDGHFDEAAVRLNQIRDANPDPDAVIGRWIEAAALAIESGLGRLGVESREVLMRVGKNRLNSITGVRDFEVAVCSEALDRLGFSNDARVVIADFTTDERPVTGRPPTRMLARAISTIMPSPTEQSAGGHSRQRYDGMTGPGENDAHSPAADGASIRPTTPTPPAVASSESLPDGGHRLP